MAWTTTGGNLKGDPGTPGAPGRSITAGAIQPDGSLQFTFSDATTQNVGIVKGLDGKDGSSVSIGGTVANAAALPTGLGTADRGTSYITSDDGHLHVWTGSAFTDVGEIRGEQGLPGNPGNPGVRGTEIYTGNGAPVDGAYPDARAGDLYIDKTSGDLLIFS